MPQAAQSAVAASAQGERFNARGQLELSEEQPLAPSSSDVFKAPAQILNYNEAQLAHSVQILGRSKQLYFVVCRTGTMNSVGTDETVNATWLARHMRAISITPRETPDMRDDVIDGVFLEYYKTFFQPLGSVQHSQCGQPGRLLVKEIQYTPQVKQEKQNAARNKITRRIKVLVKALKTANAS